jgi:hypothetical protein
MKRLPQKLLTTGLATATFVVGFMLTNAPQVAAAYAYNPANLISDSVFTNSSSMSASAIQTFLNNENSGLKSRSDTENCSAKKTPYRFIYYPHCSKKESAATIIYDAGRAYGINPRAIMATLQKEQSLITTPNPTSSQINCAMGYNSCSGFVGFFSQVDNGAWQLRTDIELMNGRNWWGYAPSSYPCKSGNGLYSTGLYPGRTVKFADPGGKAETITLADSSTAALYCYTPYVGPYSTTGYSGSYNFVQSFEQWWGSTVYSWAGDVTVTTYSDAARTQQLSLSGPLPSGKTIYVTVSAINTGSHTWSNSFAHVGTSNPHDRSSAFQDESWLAYDRPTRLTQSSVAPTQTGTFKFSITTPKKDGEYHEDFGLVAESRAWMHDSATFGFDIIVSNQYNGTITQLNTYSDSAYSQLTDPGEMAYGNEVYVRLKVKNIGTQTWSNSFTRIGTSNPNDRASVFQDSSWLSSTRPTQLMESSVAPGQVGTFEFSMTAPNTDGAYSESFGVVAEGKEWMPAPTFTFPIKIVDPPLDTLYSGIRLYPGQSLESKNGQYRLAMQTDGNLVIYSSKGAIWASGTGGKNVKDVDMQTDGNLVIYNTSGKPLWYSATSGKGPSTLHMQADGNLVLYDGDGHATWASGTGGPV